MNPAGAGLSRSWADAGPRMNTRFCVRGFRDVRGGANPGATPGSRQLRRRGERERLFRGQSVERSPDSTEHLIPDQYGAREVVSDPAEAEDPGGGEADRDQKREQRRKLGGVCRAGNGERESPDSRPTPGPWGAAEKAQTPGSSGMIRCAVRYVRLSSAARAIASCRLVTPSLR
jgi:hypothetical protein